MSLKSFLMKKMMKSQLKGVPEAEQDRIIEVIEKNPEVFEIIAAEVQAKTKEGKDQMAATMEVMKNHQSELQQILGK
ncbi:MAG: hypothetical protein WCT19_02965 [Candidatus Paceibacterota bacterium]|jgi:hypothetical protein